MGQVYTSGKRGGKPKQIDGFTGSMQIITETTTWTCPATGEYYISCIGQGGSHSWSSVSPSIYAGTGGGGGISESNLKLQKGAKINITIDAGVSSFGSELSATGGENANLKENVYNIANGGNASGGNIGNFAGEKGKNAQLTDNKLTVQGGGTSTSAKYGGAAGGICQSGYFGDVAFSTCPSPSHLGMYPYGSSQSWGSYDYSEMPLAYGESGYIKNGAVIIEYMG